ncbi:MAG: hypothetical protein AB7P07_07000 [Hyphomonadaceae bacterium]
MSLRKGPSRFWAMLHRMGMARARMPFWRVVIEARLDRRARPWPRDIDGAVTAVFVWARTVEEAEGLAALAIEEEGLAVITADALKCPPAARPRRAPAAVSRTELGFLPLIAGDVGADPHSRRDARA